MKLNKAVVSNTSSYLTEDTTPRVREMAFRISSILQSSLYFLIFTNGWLFFHFQWPSGVWIWYECSRLQHGQKICKFFSSINCPFIVQCEAPKPIRKIILKCRLPTHHIVVFPSFCSERRKKANVMRGFSKLFYSVPNYLQADDCLEIIITVIKAVSLRPVVPAFPAALVHVVIIK